MSNNEPRRALRVQPSSDIKTRLKARFRTTKHLEKSKPKSKSTTSEQLKECLDEFKSFDDDELQNFKQLLELVSNASQNLLAHEELFGPLFEKANISLCSDNTQMRTLYFRLLRLLLVNQQRLAIYLDLLMDLFAVRSLDILVLPKTERLEALRLLAKMLNFYVKLDKKPEYSEYVRFPTSALKSIHAVAVHRLIVTELGEQEPKIDELNKAALGIILEISTLDPLLSIESCSTDWIPRVLVSPGINNFQISVLVCRVLSAWLEDPVIRQKAELQLVLEQVFAPLLDLGFFNQSDPKLKNAHKITQTLENCANIFLNLMYTWSGFYACASIEPLVGSMSSPLKLLGHLGQVKSVGTNLDKLREMVIDVCCDFVSMPYAGKTFTSWPETLLFYSKLHQPDLYESSLRDDFVVGEMNSICFSGVGDTEYVDFLLSFRALATFTLLNFGLVRSLIRLILSSPNEPMALKATLLLGDLLRTSISFIPKDWKQLLLSVPTLIQLMAQSLLNTVAGQIEKREVFDSERIFPSSENSILLLHRLEELYSVSQTRPTFLSQLKNANLFVLPNKAGHDRPRGGKFYDNESELDGQCSDAISGWLSDEKQKWVHFEFLLQRFRNLPSLFNRWQHNDKCHTFFVQVTEFFAPKNQMFLKEPITHEIVKMGSLAFRLIVRLAESEPYYTEMLEKYVMDFCREIPENVLYNGVFSPRNIMHTNVYLYFGITAAIGSKSHGHWMLEKFGFYQICLNLVTGSAPIEYVKLILSSLNYTKTGITRHILESALTATNEHTRIWATRFLEVILALQVLPDFEDYGMRLLFQQLADPSGKVVRNAVKILNKWLSKFPKSLKQLKNVRLESLGDSGILLEVHLYSSEECVRLDIERARSSLKYWMKTFNEQYVNVIEDEMRLVLTNFKRSMSGRFARLSAQRKPQQTVRASAHIFSSLTKHPLGIQLLGEEDAIFEMLNCIKQPITKDGCLKVKAALLALGHFIGNVDGEIAERILPSDTVELICEISERCEFLSVRGIAFFALNLSSQSKFGVRELSKLGWESNRHIDLQEELNAQLWSQQSNAMNSKNVENKEGSQQRDTLCVEEGEFRSSRSNSLYTRAGNEALTSLKHRAIQSRRRNTSSCLSQNRLSESLAGENEDLEFGELEFGELEFDAEIYGVLNNPATKPSEILIRNAVKKHSSNRTPNSSKDASLRLLQRNFLNYSKGSSVLDKFWFLSDSETNELMEYRTLLEFPDNIKRTRTLNQNVKRSQLERSLIQNSIGNNWTVCTLPCDIQLICEQIFQTSNIHIKLDKKTRIQTDSATENGHNSKKCLYCTSITGNDTKFSNIFAKFELSEQLKLDFEQRRDDILVSMTMLEIRELTYQTRLANHFRSCSLFQHPCIYSDALDLLNELPYSLETRSFIQQLFFQCLTQLTEKK